MAPNRSSTNPLGGRISQKRTLGSEGANERECSGEADIGCEGRPSFQFKKKKPLAGAYPPNFSPYRLTNTHAARNPVSLIRTEIAGDLRIISDALAEEFKSHYFEECGAPDQTSDVGRGTGKISNSKPLRRTGRTRAMTSSDPFQSKNFSKAATSVVIPLRENIIRNTDLHSATHNGIAAFAG
jgi:hypothetical protein